MADNTELNVGADGDIAVTREISHAGDTAKLTGAFLMGITGSEGSYTAAAINGDATNGLDVDVTRLPALVAGTANIGDVDVASIAAGDNNIGNVDIASIAAGDNNIGNVDVLSVVPGVAATSLGKAEDAAHSSGDVGVMALAVRQSSQSDFGADGDYVPLSIDDDGAVRVAIISGAGSGGTAQADDADFTDGTTQGTPAMGVYESTPSTVTDGDLGVVGITEDRELKVSVSSGGIPGFAEDAAASGGEEGVMVLAVRRDSAAVGSGTDGDFSTLNVDASGRLWANVANTVTVASHAVTNAGTFAVQVSSISAGDNNIGNVDLASAIPAGTNNIGDVDILTIAAGDNNIGNVDIVSLPASTNTIETVGDAAHGAAVAGNPLLQGLEGRSTAPTAVDDGDVVRALATLLGKQVVLPYAIPASTKSYASPAAVTDTSDDEAFAAIASTRTYITSAQFFCDHATVGTVVVIKDGSTVLFRGYAAPVGGGAAIRFDPPLRGTANTAVNVANITNSSSTYFNLQGYSATE